MASIICTSTSMISKPLPRMSCIRRQIIYSQCWPLPTLTRRRVLVHCRGGHRRSTAIAIGVLIQHGMDYKKAFAHVEAIRDGFMPNQLFIKYIDEHFGLQSRLIEHAAKHRLARESMKGVGA